MIKLTRQQAKLLDLLVAATHRNNGIHVTVSRESIRILVEKGLAIRIPGQAAKYRATAEGLALALTLVREAL